MNNKIVYIDKKQIRSNFNCESENLNKYIKETARQHHVRNLSKTYVLLNKTKVVAFFTLFIESVELNIKDFNLPKDLKEEKETVPGVVLGMLARDISLKNLDYGNFLINEAMRKSYQVSEIVGIKGMFLKAENETVCEKFYDKLEFLKKIDDLSYYVPTKTLELIFKDND